ncbi:MAG: DUF5050 domain-containing protein [Syntrophomonadaceae bacterium]
MKYCGKCGSPMNNEAQFCGSCGAVNDALEIVRSAGNQAPSAPDARQVKKKAGAGSKVKISTLIVLILTLIGGSVWGWSYYSKQVGKPNNAALPTGTSEVANQAAGQPAPAKVESSFGNTIGNLNNWGIACQKGDWIYYGTTNGKLYRCNMDGGSQQLIFNDPSFGWIHGINVADNWVFFKRANNGPLYRIDTDGKNLKMIDGTNRVSLLLTYKDWIYFVSNPSSVTYTLCRAALDGNNLQVLDKLDGGGQGYQGIQIIDQWVYFSIGQMEKPNKLYRMRLDGSSKSEIEGLQPSQFSIAEDWLYTGSYGGIYRTNIESKVQEKLCDAELVVFLNPSDGWIYYCNTNERNLADTGVYRMRLDGTAQEKVNSEQAGMINIVGDWIYYINMAKDSGSLTRIHIDGSGKENLS